MKNKIPEGRGIPEDVEKTGANCGPSALAAYLNIPTSKVINSSYEYQEKGYISMKPMLRLLNELGIDKPHKSIKLVNRIAVPSEFLGNSAGLAFIQWVGPEDIKKYSGWKGWSTEMVFTHWIAYDKGMIYDVNARHSKTKEGNWVHEAEWLQKIVPIILPQKAIGHYIKNIVV